MVILNHLLTLQCTASCRPHILIKTKVIHYKSSATSLVIHMIMTRDYSELIAQLCSLGVYAILVAIHNYICGIWNAQWYTKSLL